MKTLMFDNAFSHYLTYGATDQHTIIDLSTVIDGIIVPSTVAAFQRDGTGGFVLSLSAREASPKYAIDPRFPLFQQSLNNSSSGPKKSHQMLAELLGDPGLISNQDPKPDDFDDDRIRNIAEQWVTFNTGYTQVDSKFDKYAKRLGEKILPEDAKSAEYIIAPYFMAGGQDDPWWERSKKFFEATKTLVKGGAECIRVIALKSASALESVGKGVDDEKVAIWVNDLHELNSDSYDLSEYLKGIRALALQGKSVFALYGGFLSVIAGNLGLKGSCHGIGFGEHRKWIELPSSGPAPARFYSPFLHRYIPQEDAYSLWQIDESVFGCKCNECQGGNPLALDYHGLMKHSVRCRAEETKDWRGLSLDDVSDGLKEQYAKYVELVESSKFPERIQNRLLALSGHLPKWFKSVDAAK